MAMAKTQLQLRQDTLQIPQATRGARPVTRGVKSAQDQLQTTARLVLWEIFTRTLTGEPQNAEIKILP